MKLHLNSKIIKPGVPLWQLADCFANQLCGALLDSAMDHEKLGRHSFLAGRPTALLKAKRLPVPASQIRDYQLKLIRWRSPEGADLSHPSSVITQGKPLAALRDLQT